MLELIEYGGFYMACFTIPLAEAIVVSAVKAVTFKKNTDNIIDESKKLKIQDIRKKIGWLQKMLFGGSYLLAIEHIYHGEVSFVPPFLTAMKTPEEIPVMLHEMATVGVGMAVLTTAVWGIIVAVTSVAKKKNNPLAAQGEL